MCVNDYEPQLSGVEKWESQLNCTANDTAIHLPFGWHRTGTCLCSEIQVYKRGYIEHKIANGVKIQIHITRHENYIVQIVSQTTANFVYTNRVDFLIVE